MSVLVPVRCFSCGNLIADKFKEYQNRVKSGEDSKKVLDSFGFKRYCCRAMILTSVETIHQVIPFYEAIKRREQEVRAELE